MRMVGGDCAVISCAHSRSLPQAALAIDERLPFREKGDLGLVVVASKLGKMCIISFDKTCKCEDIIGNQLLSALRVSRLTPGELGV